MSQFLRGAIRQLTERKPPAGPLGRPEGSPPLAGTVSQFLPGRLLTSEFRKQQNLRIQCAADYIVTKLIAADIIHSQRCDQVDEIIREILFAAFDSGGVLPHAPQPTTRGR